MDAKGEKRDERDGAAGTCRRGGERRAAAGSRRVRRGRAGALVRRLPAGAGRQLFRGRRPHGVRRMPPATARCLRAAAGAGAFPRAALAGLGAAAVGAGIYIAVRYATGYQVGLISILVGFLVGRAVHWGSRGRGGWPYQALAMVLTYLAIVSIYVPILYRLEVEQGHRLLAAGAGIAAAV